MNPTALKLLDFVLLQVGWFACVLGAARGHFWLGPAVVAGALAIHCWCAPRPGRDLRLAAIMAVVGALADGLLVGLGVLDFGADAPRLAFVPVWLFALWPLFASTFHSMLAWLQPRPVLAAALGLLGGPPGYVAADRLGALRLGEPLWSSVLALGVVWALVMPLGLWIARRQAAPPPATVEATA